MSRKVEYDVVPHSVGKEQSRPDKGLSAAHLAVVNAYFKNGCRSKRQALKDAGYRTSTAEGNPASVFRHPMVQAEIARRLASQERRAEITAERIEQAYADIAFIETGDFLEIDEDGSVWVDLSAMDHQQKRAIKHIYTEDVREGRGEDGRTIVKTRIEFYDRLKALDALAKIKGMMKEKVELSGPDLVALMSEGRRAARKEG